MKTLAFALLIVTAAIGCKSGAQVPPNPTAFSCPSVTGTNYTALGPASPNLTQSDTPAAGTYCYTGQSVSSAFTPPLQSTAAAPTAPQTVSSGQTVTLSITPPATGVAPTGYIVSRAPATAVTILAPAIGGQATAHAEVISGNAPTLVASVK